MYLLCIICLLSAFNLHAHPQPAISRYGDMKYQPGFKSFDYANPNAPRGGTLNLGVVGTFDSTNPFITKGTPPVGLSLFSEAIVFEQLMKRSADEPFTLYGLIAEKCDIASDKSHMTFYINPAAKWPDGQPVTAHDVAFSHETLKKKGRPNLRLFYSRVKNVDVIDAHTIKFTFQPISQDIYDAELPYLVALMSVIPSHIYKDRDFEKVSIEKVMGSGPYKITTIKPGHYISYDKRPDYWGKDLPINQGAHNFGTIAVTYYREPNIALMAFATGQHDIQIEHNPTTWFRNYNFKKSKSGQIHKETIRHGQAVGMHGFCFNQRRSRFMNRDVRHALALVFPFESINKMLFHTMFVRNKSYYDNTDLAASGLPTPQEIALLKDYRVDLPTDLYDKPFDPTDGLMPQERIHRARQLLQAAGWILKQGQLVNSIDHEKFTLEILLYNKDDEKIALAYGRELKKLGITLTIRTLDTAQFESRRLKMDFDCIIQTWGGTESPGAEQAFYWGSQQVDVEGSRNYAGIKRPVVDALCDQMTRAQTRADLKNIAHALDRVLLWDYSVVPLYYNPQKFIAYWDKLGHPTIGKKGSILLQYWWATTQ